MPKVPINTLGKERFQHSPDASSYVLLYQENVYLPRTPRYEGIPFEFKIVEVQGGYKVNFVEGPLVETPENAQSIQELVFTDIVQLEFAMEAEEVNLYALVNKADGNYIEFVL
ncbi:hypothetical protein HYV12_02670 [Candidatus Dojkabacteria bacterium]|nr:hypothetical protein [Candidatus Dojkabacteria bacterium]